jgi:hypothetical protein
MLHRLIAAMFIALPCTTLLAAEIKGKITDEQGTAGLPGVRVCLSVAGAAPGECSKTRITNKKGNYSFNGLNAGEPYTLKVLTESSLTARKADPYPNLVWEPVSHEIELASRKERVGGVDFKGSFGFRNFQAELQLKGADFPELANYDLANDYVFLKVYTMDSSGSEQNLIFLGQVTDSGKLLIEVSVPLSASVLTYEVYSANAPDPVIVSIDLVNPA